MGVTIHRPSTLSGASDLDFSRCHVLVLDPFIATRRIVCDILMRDMRVGAVDACATVGDALKKLSAGGWNILLTDWSAGLDAISLLKTLRAPTSPLRFLPVVVMTSDGHPEAVRVARDAGMNEFMLKPFSAMVVQSRLKSVTQMPRVFVESPDFFGPDRRRRHDAFDGLERRLHTNTRYADRRRVNRPVSGPERRQGKPGFQAPDRRQGGR